MNGDTHDAMLDRGNARPQMQGDMDRGQLLEQHHRRTLWVWWTVMILGAWVAVAPFSFGYGNATVTPSGGREVWLGLSERVAAMRWSDVASGLGLMVLAWRSLTPNRPIAMWAACLVGCWLTVAPVIFWSPSAAAYMNDTIVGMLVIALTVLVPGMPNMVAFMKMGGDTPRGWSYNPSSWPQRWIMIGLAFVGFVVSRYLAAYQLGYIDQVWEPFFGDGSRRVLDSKMSHGWPISDAGLGAVAYTFEFLMGFMGATSRWRTMPWMVALFGILVIPLGLAHIVLVISQPVMVGAWCTFCLLAAAIMLPMLPLEADEVIAMGQHMVESKRKGHSLWTVFWKGGPAEGATHDERSPALMKLPDAPRSVVDASTWGMSVPWTLLASAAVGLLLVFLPLMLGFGKPLSDVAQLGGLLFVTFAVVAMGEPLRALRLANVLVAASVAVLGWILGGNEVVPNLIVSAMALAVALLSLPRGMQKEHYGLWDRFVV
jgi:hypothetical protein